MLRIFRFQTVQHCLLQQDSLLSEADLSQYFAPDVAGPLADFVVAGSEDEEHAGSSCSASSKWGLLSGSATLAHRIPQRCDMQRKGSQASGRAEAIFLARLNPQFIF